MARNWGPRSTSSFGKELKRLRQHRGWTLRTMGHKTRYNYSYLGRIERGERRATRDLAERCDVALQAGDILVAAWRAENRLSRPAQLPANPTRLVGRSDQLALLDQALHGLQSGAPAVVTIDGPAGVGKTTLALRWAHDNSDRFIDGQLYADLCGFDSDGTAPTNPGAVLAWFCTALGAKDIPASTAERAALWRSLLADRRVLVVLDNAVDSAQVKELLPGASGCVAIVTSRRVLSGLSVRADAQRLALGPLSEADSVALVGELIGSALARQEPSAVRALCRLCDYLPLALRIAGERVVSAAHSVETAVQELTCSDSRRLDHLENGDSPGLRTVISRSYERLAPEPARIFRLLGMHGASPTHVGAVAALAGVDIGAAKRTLRELAHMHLVSVPVSRNVEMLGVVSAFAQERSLVEDNAGQRAEAVQRIVTWSIDAAEASLRLHGRASSHRVASAVATTPVQWCERELRNYVRVSQTALEHGLIDATWLCAATLWHSLMVCHPDGVWPAVAALRRAGVDSGYHGEHAGSATYRQPRDIPLQQNGEAVAGRGSPSVVAQKGAATGRAGYGWTLVGAAFVAIEFGQPHLGRDLGNEAGQLFEQAADRDGEVASLLAVAAAIQSGAGSAEDALSVFTEAGRIAAMGSPDQEQHRPQMAVDEAGLGDQGVRAIVTVRSAVRELRRAAGWVAGTQVRPDDQSSGRNQDAPVR